MRQLIGKFITTLFVACFLLSFYTEAKLANAQTEASQPSDFTKAELEKLLQPIALYPDILLQQLLAASTFPEQIIDAANYNEQGKPPEGISKQPWDPSVQAIANYPSIVTMMTNDIDWTLSIASAFVNQSVELRKAIQTLRAKAKTVGNLKTTKNEEIIVEPSPSGETVIRIESTDPQVIYVPASTSTVVYEKPVDTTNYWLPLASFGVGMALGYAMGDDDDDDHYYYGGYYGPSFWHREDAVDNWVDYRQDRWDDAYDFANDRQDWRQDNADDWREYRQDLGRGQQEWLNQRNANGEKYSPEQRAEARNKTSQAKTNWQNSSSQQKQDYAASKGWDSSSFDKQQASERVNAAKSNPQVQNRMASSDNWKQRAQPSDRSYYPQQKTSGSSFSGNRASNANGSGLKGMGSSGFSASRAQSRGSVSRGRAGGGGRGR